MKQHVGRSAWTTAEPQPSFWQRHGQRIVALLFWLALLGGYQWYASRNDLSPLQALAQVIDLLRSTTFGPILFIAIYTLRPLILFPATVLTLGAGLVFGPLWGIVYTIVGSNLSALLAFGVGRFLGAGVLDGEQTSGVVQRYADRLRRNSFETVLIMRFVFLPYDLVNYLSGVLRINWKAFLLATAIGSLPGTIAFVLAGSSITGDLTDGLPGFDWRVFAVSVALLIISLAISRVVKRREQHTP
jgi:uncharacterized membrane protein YdjX (TVP38/TMEM64 family)